MTVTIRRAIVFSKTSVLCRLVREAVSSIPIDWYYVDGNSTKTIPPLGNLRPNPLERFADFRDSITMDLQVRDVLLIDLNAIPVTDTGELDRATLRQLARKTRSYRPTVIFCGPFRPLKPTERKLLREFALPEPVTARNSNELIQRIGDHMYFWRARERLASAIREKWKWLFIVPCCVVLATSVLSSCASLWMHRYQTNTFAPITLTTSPNSVIAGATVTINAHLSPSHDAWGLATCQLVFNDRHVLASEEVYVPQEGTNVSFKVKTPNNSQEKWGPFQIWIKRSAFKREDWKASDRLWLTPKQRQKGTKP